MAKSGQGIVTGLVRAKQKAVRQAENDAEESGYYRGRFADPDTPIKESNESFKKYEGKNESSNKIEDAAIENRDWDTALRITNKSIRGGQAYDVSKGVKKASDRQQSMNKISQSSGPLLNPWKQKSK